MITEYVLPVVYIGVIMGLVEMVKRLGVTGNVLIVVSVAIGFLLSGFYILGQMYPNINPWVEFVFFGFAYGLAAAGIYDIINNRFPKV